MDEGKPKVLLDPKIYLVNLDDEQETFSLVFETDGGFEEMNIFEVLLLTISLEEKSKVLLDPEIFFNGLGDWMMKFPNEDEPKLGLEEWNSSNVDSFVEK